ncbi:hypothetical protein FQR65_LT02442 [Abscondita terminalis]|nr:hypothetical protein FQR65_LT02442 [Abscondita terminalis]
MYYLAKFCRICIQTGVELTDIDSTDYDSVKFSEKLEICTQMIITRESLSTKICLSCINKLRVSYQFHSMCKKSTTILQQYLSELLSNSGEIVPDKFVLSEIQVNVPSKIPKSRRRRVGKDERCTLLKKLLSKVTHDQFMHNMHIKGLTKLCNRIAPSEPNIPSTTTLRNIKNKQKRLKSGGLRNLLNFTKDFDFGYDISLVETSYKNIDLTPLEQLAKFTENFFCDHFLDYRETIINIGETLESDCSDEEGMFDECIDEEPEIRVKEEIIILDSNLQIKSELIDESDDNYQYSSTYVQACYDNNNDAIKEEFCGDKGNINEYAATSQLQQRYSEPDFIDPDHIGNILISNYKKYRTLSHNSAKCRTRDNPFISPHLQKQFLTRNFKCTTCNRRFKSPGYLKAHCSRFKH